MSTDLEQRLRESLENASRQFAPSPDLRARVDQRLASHHRRRRAQRLAAGLVILLIAAGGGLARTLDEGSNHRVAVVADRVEHTDGWVTATDPNLGWHFEHPGDWTVQNFSRQCRIGLSGTFVTNLPRPVEFQAPPAGCTTARDLAGVPDSFVGVEMSHYSGGVTRPGLGQPDTVFPLSLSKTTSAVPSGDVAQEPDRLLAIVVGGDGRYAVTAWVGPKASVEDLAAAERLVASIRPAAAGHDAQARAWQEVEFHGVSVSVPAPWTVLDLQGYKCPGNDEVIIGYSGSGCVGRFDTQYVPPRVSLSCSDPGGTKQPTATTMVDGVRGEVYEHDETWANPAASSLRVPDHRFWISVDTQGDAPLQREILESVRIVRPASEADLERSCP